MIVNNGHQQPKAGFLDQKKLYLDLNHAFNSLYFRLTAIAGAAYNDSAGGKWSAGQLADHLTLSAGSFLELVNGPVELRNGPPDKKIPVIREFMFDFSRKYPSPKNIIPGNGPFDRAFQTEDLNQLQLGWLEASRLLDPAPTCLLFRVPTLGLLTRLEAGHFTLCHLQRHLYQMGEAG